jgi:ABC-type multidrug transport system ATPase subunit/ABC-type multidrug transport system permease subunit
VSEVAVRVEGVDKVFAPPPAPWRRLLRRPEPPGIVALRGIDLEVRRGEILGLVGENGAGKTVLVKLIATLTEPTRGRIQVFGLDAVRQARVLRARLGLTTADERSFYWRLTPRQNLRFFARLHGAGGRQARRRVDELLERVDLLPLADRPYRMLSAGNRQRLALARALLGEPELLLLDEPTSSLDPLAAARLRALIRERVLDDRRRAVLFTTHDLSEVDDLCERVTVLRSGRCLWSGPVAALRQRFGGDELVTLTARGIAPADLDGAARGQTVRASAAGVVVELAPGQGGEALAAVVAQVVRAGGRVVACRTQRRPLQQVFEALVGAAARQEEVPAGGSDGLPAPPPAAGERTHSAAFAPASPAAGRERGWLRSGRALWAFLARDALMAVSYRLEFVLQLGTVFVYVSALYFLSLIIGDNPALAPYGGYLPFAAIGMAVASWFQTGFDSFAKAVHREQLHGTLEALLLAPLRLATVVVACSAWRFLWTTLVSAIYVVAAVVLYDLELQGSPLLALALLALTTLAFASLGILSASFVMVYKRGDPIGMVLGSLSTLLGGVFFPVSALPDWLRTLAWCLPITHGVDGIRAVLLQGAGLAEVRTQTLVLLGFAAVGVPLSLACFRRAVRRAQREGTLLHF